MSHKLKIGDKVQHSYLGEITILEAGYSWEGSKRYVIKFERKGFTYLKGTANVSEILLLEER